MFTTVRPVIVLCAMAFLSGGGIYADVLEFSSPTGTTGGTITFGVSAGNDAVVDSAYINKVADLDTAASVSITGSCDSGLYGCLTLQTGVYASSSSSGDTTTVTYLGAGSSLSISGMGGTLFQTEFVGPITLEYNTMTNSGTLAGLLDAGTLGPALAADLGVPTTTMGLTDTQNDFRLNLTLGTGTITSSTVDVNTVPDGGMALMFLGGAFIAIEALRRRLHV
jgi:hypothetical protein